MVEVAEGHDAERIGGLVVPSDGSLAGLAVRTGRPAVATDIRTDARARAWLLPDQESEFGPLVAVPLVAHERSSGALRLCRLAGRPAFDDHEVELLSNWPGTVPSPSIWRCCTTATGSPVTCMTWRFSGCSRRG
jgi:hypothetical protein